MLCKIQKQPGRDIKIDDDGENWDWVISEGGVDIAVERIKGGFAAITYNTESKTRRVRTRLILPFTHHH